VCAHRDIPELELEGGVSRIGSEGVQGFLGHANDHGALRQRLRGL
jgi:hypothetical protein